ncbi:hypothetical protein Cch01nite_28700 [Cellulomonas chitinilytica]|uniref:DUF4244 domain-containing protein n=1 Tax=Cellulomonas chitinilytica TaxID=398759 RepID=A0A919U297_9CELL|nr:DUF4244 domain-containing protein [Cellulomonas chitinilytica]GIG22146.1 hypothetical protein Cch01nite_28700 [Cellulomonas chitinilytica]
MTPQTRTAILEVDHPDESKAVRDLVDAGSIAAGTAAPIGGSTARSYDLPVDGPPLVAATGNLTGRARWRAIRPTTGARVVRRAAHLRQVGADAGMATAEYAIATLAAVGFAGLLVVILKGNEVRSMLMALVRQALTS